MNPSLMKINNPNLLRSVLYGDASEISKLKFIWDIYLNHSVYLTSFKNLLIKNDN